jgi:thiamine biosynthesis lipoprotein
MQATSLGRYDSTALGTFVTLLVADPGDLGTARDVLAAELAAIDAACSRFRADSELSRACAAGGRRVPVSPLFAGALSAALTAAALTGGDVDPTCGRALVALGYDQDFAAARRDTGAPGATPVPGGSWREVILDTERQEVTVPDGVLLDLGATAKALAADRAAAAITAATGGGALVNLGGDISVAGPPPADGWLVGVVDDATFDTTTASVQASQAIVIRDGGLATSSVLGRAWQRGDARLHHIIDPRTGLPASSCWRTVSVAARTCVAANVASTAAIVRGERAVAWLERLGLPSRLVRHDGGVVTVADWPAPGSPVPGCPVPESGA